MNRNKKMKQEITALFLIIGIFIILQWSGIGWHCPFHSILGIPCPGCGFTRAWQEIIKFNLVAALYYHPLFWLPPIAYIYYVYANYFSASIPKHYKKVMYIAAFAFLIVYGLRCFGALPNSYKLEINQNALLLRVIGRLLGH